MEALRLHVAGATVRHNPPFEHLSSFENNFDLSQEFIDEWVKPFYLDIGRQTDTAWIDRLISIKGKITTSIIEKCLGDFNWRTRKTGAFFAAITNQTQYIDIIGTHLLKSEVCCVGDTYCVVLASFNTLKCLDYLNLYLDYYLQKPDLNFDQPDAMRSVMYLDKLNSTNHLERHIDKWNKFVGSKINRSPDIIISNFEQQLYVIETVKKAPVIA